MWLEYGITSDGQWAHISQVDSGLQRHVFCPYCRGMLLAKKGRRVVHHFAHQEQSCRYVSRPERIDIPLYRFFTYHLTPKQTLILHLLYQANQHRPFVLKGKTGSAAQTMYHAGVDRFYDTFAQLQEKQFITRVSEGVYALTPKALLVNGGLSIREFYLLQRQQIREAYRQLLQKIKENTDTQEQPYLLLDKQIFDSHVARLQQQQLYLVQFTFSTGILLYKIGITSRPIPERIAELVPPGKECKGEYTTELLFSSARMALVEPYFKHRFRQWALGKHTEYFRFSPQVVQQAVSELKQLSMLLDGNRK